MFQDIDLHAEPAVLAPQLDDPDLLGRAVVRRTGRTRRVDRFDPALDGALTEIVLLHDLPLGLADVVELDYLPLELVGEMPGVPGALMRLSRLSRPSRNCPYQCGQSRKPNGAGGAVRLSLGSGAGKRAEHGPETHRNTSASFLQLGKLRPRHPFREPGRSVKYGKGLSVRDVRLKSRINLLCINK